MTEPATLAEEVVPTTVPGMDGTITGTDEGAYSSTVEGASQEVETVGTVHNTLGSVLNGKTVVAGDRVTVTVASTSCPKSNPGGAGREGAGVGGTQGFGAWYDDEGRRSQALKEDEAADVPDTDEGTATDETGTEPATQTGAPPEEHTGV